MALVSSWTASGDTDPQFAIGDSTQYGYLINSATPSHGKFTEVWVRDSSQTRHGTYSIRTTCFSDSYHVNSNDKLNVRFYPTPFGGGAGTGVAEGQQEWLGWSWWFPTGFPQGGAGIWAIMEGFTANNRALYPTFGCYSWSPDSTNLKLELRMGKTLISGQPDTSGNQYFRTVNILGPGVANHPFTKGVWHDFYTYIDYRAQSNGILEIWHRQEGGTFSKLYSNRNDGSATINVAPHPTFYWNSTNGSPVSGGKALYQCYRPPSGSNVQYWADGFFVRQSQQEILTEFGAGTTPPPTTSGPAYEDPAKFPKMANHLGHNFSTAAVLSKFQLNVLRFCNESIVSGSYALNPNQVNLMVPGFRSVAGQCGNEYGVAITYGAGYKQNGAVTTKPASPFVSPWPGVGTLRAFLSTGPLADQDQLYAIGGQVVDTLYSGFRLSMDNNGTDETTAEWSARFKAHFAMEIVGDQFGPDSPKPYWHGVWGDDFIFWNHNFANRSQTVDPYQPNCSGAAYDNGLIRNHQKLRDLLGDEALLMGNGGGSIGSGVTTYAGTIPYDPSVIDGTMWEDQSTKFLSASQWDIWVPRFDAWQNQSTVSGGRQRYGIVTVYGGTDSGDLGRIPTAADKRLALAYATIGGSHLWLVNDDTAAGGGWASTVYPTGPNSIPEMGGTTEYPAGWLGDPLEGPVRIASGHWRRRFTGGTVYANATTSAAVIGGQSVPAQDAVFAVADVSAPPSPVPGRSRLGVTSAGTLTSIGNDIKRTIRRDTSPPGSTVDIFTFYALLKGPTSGGSQTFKAVVYDHAATDPTAFMGASDEVTVVLNAAEAWVEFPCSTPIRTAGPFSFGLLSGGSGAGQVSTHVATDALWSTVDTYSNGPTDPFAPIGTTVVLGDLEIAICADFIVAVDIVAPTVSAAIINGDAMLITFDEPLDPASIPDESTFTVDVDGVARSLNDDLIVSGNNVSFTLVGAVNADAVVEFDYTAPSSNKLRDLAPSPNNVANITAQSVTNDTQAPGPPELIRIQGVAGSAGTGLTGTRISGTRIS